MSPGQPMHQAAPELEVRTDLADRLATPLFVEALAEAIVRYGRFGRESGSPAPLDVFDLAPAGGVLAVRLLRALQRRLDEAGLRWRVRLHLGGAGVAAPQPDAMPIPLRAALERGDVLRHAPDALATDGLPWRDGAVVLALGYFQQMPVQLGAAHYAGWMDGAIERAPRDGEGRWPLAYRWTAAADEPRDDLRALRRLYTGKLGSAAVNLPHAGMHVLRRLAAATGEDYLLLAADAGAADLRDIQSGALVPPTQWRDGWSTMPVNFHALAWAQPKAQVAHCRNGAGAQLQVALAGGAGRAGFEHVLAAVRDGADHALQLREQAAWFGDDAPAPVWLSHLRQCAYDPHAVMEHPLGGSMPEPLDAVARDAWREALERAWQLAQDEPTSEPAVAVGMRAAHLGLWGLAVRVLRPRAAQLPPLALKYLALAELHSGDAMRAADRLAASGAGDDGAWYAHVLAHCRDGNRLAWYDPALAEDGSLRLEPLAIHHAPAWLEQYRDPHIGVMTRLPELGTLAEASDWIAEQRADPSRACFAVVDREHGFVGSACYQRAGDSGYFHFWIGIDHQNRGLGRRAGQLLQRQARRAGVACLYTSAYPDNPRSQAALAALGFVPLAIRAETPDDDLLFFALPLAPGARPTADGLRRLCRAVDSPMAFVRETAAA